MTKFLIHQWSRIDFGRRDAVSISVFPYELIPGIDLQPLDQRLVLTLGEGVFCEVNGSQVFELAELTLPSILKSKDEVFVLMTEDSVISELRISETSLEKSSRLKTLLSSTELGNNINYELLLTECAQKSGRNSLFDSLRKTKLGLVSIGISVIFLVGFLLGLPTYLFNGFTPFSVGEETAQASEPPESVIHLKSEQSNETSTHSGSESSRSERPLKHEKKPVLKDKSPKTAKNNSSASLESGLKVSEQQLSVWKKRHAKAILISGFDPGTARTELRALQHEVPKTHAFSKILLQDIKKIK
jgi:hypothetical protein